MKRAMLVLGFLCFRDSAMAAENDPYFAMGWISGTSILREKNLSIGPTNIPKSRTSRQRGNAGLALETGAPCFGYVLCGGLIRYVRHWTGGGFDEIGIGPMARVHFFPNRRFDFVMSGSFQFQTVFWNDERAADTTWRFYPSEIASTHFTLGKYSEPYRGWKIGIEVAITESIYNWKKSGSVNSIQADGSVFHEVARWKSLNLSQQSAILSIAREL